jgi:hypothetical protein
VYLRERNSVAQNEGLLTADIVEDVCDGIKPAEKIQKAGEPHLERNAVERISVASRLQMHRNSLIWLVHMLPRTWLHAAAISFRCGANRQ